MRTLSATLLAILLPAAAAAAPIQITGRVLHPPKDVQVQVELRPWAAEPAEALASARLRPDGSFALKVPDTGFYSVVVRAEGYRAMQGFAPFVFEDVVLPAVELPPAQAIPIQPESGEWRLAERQRARTAESRTLVTGRVLDASSREPIAGALVWNGGSDWTRTGAGGAFELRAPSGDRGRIEASAPGRMIHVQPWAKERNASITFLLEAAASISGQVVDGEGKPVEGARITTLLNPGEGRSLHMEERSASSGADGRFVLRKLPAGKLHAVEAVLEGFAPARQLADSTAPVRLVLRRGALAAGRIVDEEGGPVAGVRVSLAAVGEEGAPAAYPPFQGTSDSDGRFRLPGVSAGRFSLQAESQGFVTAVVEDVLIPEREPEVDLGEIRLLAGGAIEGIVTDTSGRPVEGAWIALSPSGVEDFMTVAVASRRPAETGPDGRFRIEDLPRGARYDLEADHAELQPAEVLGVEVPTAEPLRIRLSHPRTLSGRVVDELGGPIAGASVYPSVTTVAPDGSTRSRVDEKATTDPEGRFRLSRVSLGPVRVQASAPGYGSGEVLIQVPEEGEAEPVEIALGPGTSLEGRVLDSHGRPVRRARIELRILREDRGSVSSGMTDEEGRYEMVDLEPGPCEVAAHLDQRGRVTRAAMEIRPGRNRLDLRFPAGVEVSGRVLDSRGEPLLGASLSLEAVQQQDRPVWPLQATSSADGSFVLAGVTDGEYRLIATRRGFGASAVPGGVRVDGAPVGGLELRLSPGAVIRGRILGLQPGEARGASVMAYSESFGTPLQGTVSPGPAYRIADVAPGEWHVVAQIPPQLSIEGTVEVAAGAEEAVLDLEPPPGFTLTGRVLLDREPLPGAELMAAAQALGDQRSGRTGQDGAFRLERLPAESYVLMIEVAPGSVDYRMLEIGGDLDVTVEIATGAVEGRVLLPEGLPVAGAVVTLAREMPELETTAPGAGAQSDDRGALEILRVPAGTYELTVQVQGFAPFNSRVVVAPGGTVHLEIALGVLP